MDAPYYQVTITHLTAGWTYTRTHGVAPANMERSGLEDPLVYRWGFDDDQIPSQPTPSVVEFIIGSRTTADQPVIELGDLLSVVIRIGTTGPMIVNLTMRVTEINDDLDPSEEWAVRTAINAADLLVDLSARSVQAPIIPPFTLPARGNFRDRFAFFAFAIGRSIGCPSWWVNLQGNPDFTAGTGSAYSIYWPNVDGRTFLTSLLNCHAPSGVYHVVTPCYGPNYPAGYRWVQPDPGPGVSGNVPPDPNSGARYMLTPGGRTFRTAPVQPLRFVLDAGGLLTTSGQPSTVDDRLAAVSAAWCDVPAGARRGREHCVNTLDVSAYETDTNPDVNNVEKALRISVSSPDAITRGPISRTIETQMTVRTFNSVDKSVASTAVYDNSLAALGSVFLADETVLKSSRTYDQLTVHADSMPQAIAESVLTKLHPRYPGDGGDGQVVRHLTVHSINPSVRFDGEPVYGFIVTGALTIAGGELTYSLTTTPGRPKFLAGPAASISVGDVQTATYANNLAGSVDPSVTVADLDYIGA